MTSGNEQTLFVFTALHGMHTRSAVRILSVRLSVCQTRDLRQIESIVYPDFYTI